jgi:antitoxin VapB
MDWVRDKNTVLVIDSIDNNVYTARIHFCQWGVKMTKSTVFISNHTQAVRLPADLRLPDEVKYVEVRARGQERIITPINHVWDSFFLEVPPVSEDFLTIRTTQTQNDRENF